MTNSDRLAPFRRWLGWQAVTVSSIAALVLFIGATWPRFFFAGDKQNQYLPVARDIGRRLRDGEWLPVIDPDLGRSGNYALDLQYGLFEPTHWVVAVALSYVDNLSVAALLWAAAFLAVLGTGVCALALRLGVPGGWSAAVGVGVAASGYVLFWAAPSWIPALTSFAWVPWWWWCVTSPRPRSLGVVASGVLAFLICAGGWPATGILWAAVVAGVLVESVLRRSEPGLLRSTLLHLLASVGGGIAALVTVLPLAQAVGYTARATDLSTSGMFVPNLADFLAFASPGYEAGTPALGRYPQVVPLFFGVWFVAVLVWLVPWRRAVLQRPGVITALVGLVITLLASQAPTNLGALRWPVRMLPGVPLFLGIGVAVAVVALGLRVTRARVLGVALSLLAVSLLSWFRHPDSSDWLLPSVLMLAAAGVLLLTIRRWPGFAGPVALATTVLLAGWAVYTHGSHGMADRGTPPYLGPGTLALEDEPTLVLYPRDNSRHWFPQGIASGFLRLSAEQRNQPGYSSIGQKGWDDRFAVQSAHSFVLPSGVEQVTAIEPRTGRTWGDLLGYQAVVVHDGPHLRRFRAALESREEAGLPAEWEQSARTKDFAKFSRVPPRDDAGRVTAVLGTADVTPVEVTRNQQTYDVDTADGATLVFRDLYWPGYEATLDGEQLEVEPLGDTLVTVTLPEGSSGTLEVRYVPIATGVWVTLVALGSFLVLLAAILARRALPLGWVRRRRPGASARS